MTQMIEHIRSQEVDAPIEAAPSVGALVVGGDHPGLGVVRSLGRRGVPVYVLDDQRCISSWSRYATRAIQVDNILDERKTVDAVLEVGRRFNLKGWILIATRDETVAAFSRYRTKLADIFTVTTDEWESIQWAWDKNKTYELAAKLEIPCPKTFNALTADDLRSLYSHLPLAIKPAIRENFFYATGAKAWRANTIEQLHLLYERAARQIKPNEILLQEIIPGDGREQYSYCAYVRNGRPHSTLTARRLRQHPREFGRAATYVETTESPIVEELSERFLRAMNYNGLVEIEYKRDARDNKFKLLDVNARAWGFHSLGSACGVDFTYLLYADQLGLPIQSARAGAGVGWVRLLTDIPTAILDIAHGSLSLGTYIKSLRSARVESVFSWKDPLPSMAEVVLLPYLVAKKFSSRRQD